MTGDTSPGSGLRQSHAFDPGLHEPGSAAADGGCSHHQRDGREDPACTGPAVVSYEGADGSWESGCSAALEELVERGEIQPLGQGA
jgi:hypothetical protein